MEFAVLSNSNRTENGIIFPQIKYHFAYLISLAVSVYHKYYSNNSMITAYIWAN